jgi:hypothetical protein
MMESNEPVREPEESGTEVSKPQDDKVAEVKAVVKSMDRQDKMVLFGSAALALLFFLPWYSVSVDALGMKRSESINGLHELAWLGWMAAVAATILALTKAKILGAMPPALQTASKNTGVMVVVTGLALLAGPIYFWTKAGGDVSAEIAGVSAGKTFFFVLALLAALTAAAGAVWRLVEERKAA